MIGVMPSGRPPQVRRLAADQRDRALATVVGAFASDALLRWVWPEDRRYADCAQAFFGLLLDLRLAGGEVWAADEGLAVAMWDPPGGLYVTPAEDPWPALHATFTRTERDRWSAFDAAMAVPADAPPYWYLGVLATATDHQGLGLGSAVTAPVLAAADRAGQPAWLETMGERNLRFYARLGFTVQREADLPGGGPRCWLLRRDPGGAGG
jgi:ribosomal protein S18 acetylase RimI-like enzyme